MGLLCFQSPKCCLRHVLVHDCSEWPEAETAGAAVLSPGLCRVILGGSPGALLPRVTTAAQFCPAFGRARALTRRSSSSGRESSRTLAGPVPRSPPFTPGEAALETRARRARLPRGRQRLRCAAGGEASVGWWDVVHERPMVQPSLRLCLVPHLLPTPLGARAPLSPRVPPWEQVLSVPAGPEGGDDAFRGQNANSSWRTNLYLIQQGLL